MHWIQNHPLECFSAYVVFMAAVQALPRPTEASGALYVWLYRFLHLLAVNLRLAAKPRKSNG
jgi:hypothetical protein